MAQKLELGPRGPQPAEYGEFVEHNRKQCRIRRSCPQTHRMLAVSAAVSESGLMCPRSSTPALVTPGGAPFSAGSGAADWQDARRQRRRRRNRLTRLRQALSSRRPEGTANVNDTRAAARARSRRQAGDLEPRP